MAKRIMFLDVDGVLNYAGWGEAKGLVPVPAPYAPTVEQLVEWIDPEKMKLVNEIVVRTDAQVILSSSTRSNPAMGQVLVKAGLIRPVMGATPVLLWQVDERGNIVDAKTRADEVWESVEREFFFAGYPQAKLSFVVIDDQDHEWGRLERYVGPWLELGGE